MLHISANLGNIYTLHATYHMEAVKTGKVWEYLPCEVEVGRMDPINLSH